MFKVQKENQRQLTTEKGGKTYIYYNVADLIGLTLLLHTFCCLFSFLDGTHVVTLKYTPTASYTVVAYLRYGKFPSDKQDGKQLKFKRRRREALSCKRYFSLTSFNKMNGYKIPRDVSGTSSSSAKGHFYGSIEG